LVFHSGREADHSPPSSAEVKEWVDLFPQYAPMACAQGEHRDNIFHVRNRFLVYSTTLFLVPRSVVSNGRPINER
jgi:hypothetical protein